MCIFFYFLRLLTKPIIALYFLTAKFNHPIAPQQKDIQLPGMKLYPLHDVCIKVVAKNIVFGMEIVLIH